MDRVKINEALACPLTLDFGSILSPDQGAAGGECPRYTLAALMLHKGSAARAGHYGAANYTRWRLVDVGRASDRAKSPCWVVTMSLGSILDNAKCLLCMNSQTLHEQSDIA